MAENSMEDHQSLSFIETSNVLDKLSDLANENESSKIFEDDLTCTLESNKSLEELYEERQKLLKALEVKGSSFLSKKHTQRKKRLQPSDYLTHVEDTQSAIIGGMPSFKLSKLESCPTSPVCVNVEKSHLNTPTCDSSSEILLVDQNGQSSEQAKLGNVQQRLESEEKCESSEEEEPVEEKLNEEAYELLEEQYGKFFSDRMHTEMDHQLKDDEFAGCSLPPIIRKKTVLKHRGAELFEVLPEGWIEVTHNSGLPVYLHKSSRVCTLSRPYFLGPGSLRNHNVPVSAIPCLHQSRLQEMNEACKKKQLQDTQINGNSILSLLNTPVTNVQTLDDFKRRNLTTLQLREYCGKKFDFHTIQVLRFRSWNDHRFFYSKRKCNSQVVSDNDFSLPNSSALLAASNRLKQHYLYNRRGSTKLKRPLTSALGRPTLPTNVRLITVADMEKNCKPHRRQFCLNPQGKTSIAVLHEFVQKVLKGNVAYEFSQTLNAANPYTAQVKVASGGSGASWVAVGSGVGNSKKKAKSTAASDALRVLVPGLTLDGSIDTTDADLDDDRRRDSTGGGFIDQQANGSSATDSEATDLFDLISVIDSRVFELSIKAGQPAPFVVLQECLKRNCAFGDTTIKTAIERLGHQKHEFTMNIGGGKHVVKVLCSNKKEGKQKAAQFMLQKLQPQVNTWGALIRLYGYGAQLKLQQDRQQKDSVIRLQTLQQPPSGLPHTAPNPLEPNVTILAKLRHEMRKLMHLPSNANKSMAAEPLYKGSVKTIDI